MSEDGAWIGNLTHPMPNDKSYEWLYEQLTRLIRRIERLEGIQEELRRHAEPSSLMYPKRAESMRLKSALSA